MPLLQTLSAALLVPPRPPAGAPPTDVSGGTLPDLFGAARRAGRRLTLASRLRRAIEGGDVELHYQPILDLASGDLSGAEALLRLDGLPETTPIEEAVALAEDVRLIEPLGELVLRRAVRQAVAWRELRPLRVAVNVSIRQLEGGRLPRLVESLVAEAALDPSRIELEVTESAAMRVPAAVVGALRELEEIGVGLAIDDFGTGYSSLSYLARLPVDRLKIDRSFLRHLGSRPEAATVLAATIALGRDLGLAVTAEGVESEAHLDFVRRHRCHEAQGYWIGRPVPADELERRVAAWRGPLGGARRAPASPVGAWMSAMAAPQL